MRAFIRRHPAVLVLVVIVVSNVGFYTAQVRANRHIAAQTAQLREEAIERQVSGCEQANDFRTTFRNVLDESAQGSGPTDLSLVPGFAGLDTSTQEYVRSLSVFLNLGGNNEHLIAIRSKYVHDFPLQDCAALHRRLEAQHHA